MFPTTYLRRKIRSLFLTDVSPSSSIARLDTSFDIKKTLLRIQKHKWNVYDLQYLFDFFIACFVLSIVDASAFIKLVAIIFFSLLLLFPITSQFFFPFIPIGTWLILFFSCRFIPANWRPSISVRILPSLETILYGGNLSKMLAANTYPALDIVAWIPYGLIHYGAPFVVSGILFLFAPPRSLPVYARSFGYMNVAAVITQLLFPTSPPWYENIYGLAPATYDVKGSPGGLARVDQILGLDLYSSSFEASPLVFGAFPSLHSGHAVLHALFISNVFPKLTPYVTFWVMWVWWATMYLTHHYFIDLIGGALLSISVFYICSRNYLPSVQMDKASRWSYDYIEMGLLPTTKARLTKEFSNNDEEWAIGTSSSVASGNASPTDSPASEWEIETLADNDEFRRPLVNPGVNGNGNVTSNNSVMSSSSRYNEKI
ncbi:hypothetical protein V1511DRAFT_359984 [Dipodascopsis uninucleata]